MFVPVVISDQPSDRAVEIGPLIGVLRPGEAGTHPRRVGQTFLQPIREFIDVVDRMVAHQFGISQSHYFGCSGDIRRIVPGRAGTLFKTAQV